MNDSLKKKVALNEKLSNQKNTCCLVSYEFPELAKLVVRTVVPFGGDEGWGLVARKGLKETFWSHENVSYEGGYPQNRHI